MVENKESEKVSHSSYSCSFLVSFPELRQKVVVTKSILRLEKGEGGREERQTA